MGPLLPCHFLLDKCRLDYYNGKDYRSSITCLYPGFLFFFLPKGKSTYRTEILFKKFRWNPSYKDKNSKAYRDLLNGIRITVNTPKLINQHDHYWCVKMRRTILLFFFFFKFKEIFTRQSGQAKGGFRNATVKGVRCSLRACCLSTISCQVN